jgi:hypothetical protein
MNSLKGVPARRLRQRYRVCTHRSAGLTLLKCCDDPPPGAADYGLLLGLGLLALTGMLTLLLRATPAYGVLLVAHLTTIIVCFAVPPTPGSCSRVPVPRHRGRQHRAAPSRVTGRRRRYRRAASASLLRRLPGQPTVYGPVGTA